MAMSRMARLCAARLIECACTFEQLRALGAESVCLHTQTVLSRNELTVLAWLRCFELESIDCACTVENLRCTFKALLRCRYQHQTGVSQHRGKRGSWLLNVVNVQCFWILVCLSHGEGRQLGAGA
jgi:hypothetical protein